MRWTSYNVLLPVFHVRPGDGFLDPVLAYLSLPSGSQKEFLGSCPPLRDGPPGPRGRPMQKSQPASMMSLTQSQPGGWDRALGRQPKQAVVQHDWFKSKRGQSLRRKRGRPKWKGTSSCWLSLTATCGLSRHYLWLNPHSLQCPYLLWAPLVPCRESTHSRWSILEYP